MWSIGGSETGGPCKWQRQGVLELAQRNRDQEGGKRVSGIAVRLRNATMTLFPRVVGCRRTEASSSAGSDSGNGENGDIITNISGCEMSVDHINLMLEGS